MKSNDVLQNLRRNMTKRLKRRLDRLTHSDEEVIYVLIHKWENSEVSNATIITHDERNIQLYRDRSETAEQFLERVHAHPV